MRHKVFRDPVHSNIQIDRKSVPGKLVLHLLQCREVQRLRWIRQLPFASFVYHGAEHSRFSHSMGVLHLARRLYESAITNSGEAIDEEELAVVLSAALLHDTGHPPFSHAVETVLGVPHESISDSILRGDTEVHEVLHGFGGESFVEDVADHITGASDKRTADIISSQLDADRLDYVLRDGYHAGVPNARFDAERIIQLAYLDDDGLFFDDRAQLALEGYFIARFHLYLQLYYHKTNRAAEVILRSLIRRCRELVKEGGSLVPADSGVLDLFGADGATAASRLTDNDLWSAFRVWEGHEDSVLSDLCRRLRTRDLFKALTLDVRDGFSDAFSMREKAAEIASDLGLDPSYYVVLDEAKNTPYQVVDATSGADPHLSIRLKSGGGFSALEASSGLIRQLQQEAYQVIHLCMPEEVRDKLVT